jgi:hypothetical protein
VISNAKNKQNDGSRFSIYTTGILIKYRKCISNSWLYDHAKRKQKNRILRELQQDLEMQCLNGFVLIIIGFCSSLKSNNRKL